MQNTHETALERELEALRAIARFGWLTAAQVGSWVYPDKREQADLGRRVLRRLARKGDVFSRPLPHNAQAWLLAEGGVRRLRAEGVRGSHGKHLNTSHPVHRAGANWWLIHRRNEELKAGYDVEVSTFITERECHQRGVRIGKKIPDGVYDDGQETTTWIEVENAWKNTSRRQAIAELFRKEILPRHVCLVDDGSDLTFTDMELVCLTDRAVTDIVRAFQADIKTLPIDLLNAYRGDMMNHLRLVRLVLTPGLTLTRAETLDLMTKLKWPDLDGRGYRETKEPDEEPIEELGKARRIHQPEPAPVPAPAQGSGGWLGKLRIR